MKRIPVLFIVLLFALTATHNTDAASGNVGDKKVYPAFQIGVTGAWVRIEPGRKMFVERIDEGTPADGQLKLGDEVLAANGRVIDTSDPRVPLGTAVTEAEAGRGVVNFSIVRDGKKGSVSVRIPVLGGYAESWPARCHKSGKIIQAHAQYLAKLQNEAGWIGKGGALWEVMGALFLLSTDDPAYDDNIGRYAKVLAASVQSKPSGSAWHLGYHLIFLSEYYLKTGDASVLPAIEKACKVAADGQVAGSWSHGLIGVNPGYVQSGLMNSAGVTLFLGMTLARECGITVHEEAWQRSLVFFYRMVGHGSICYGDHRAEIYPDTNGRNAAIACAMSLLDAEVYQSAAKHLAMMVADSYASFEAGHTGGGFNVLWRGIAMSHLPDTAIARKRYQDHMSQLVWYYDLCRLPDGGFAMLPSPPDEKRYIAEHWGRGLGLTYTAPLRTLRITGAPRTKHSKRTPPLKALPWGTPKDAVFLSSEHAEGFGKDTMLAHEVQALVESKEPVDVETLATMLRHFNPYIRTRAAWKIGSIKTEEAYKAISSAIQHPDARVRRAGFDAISQYHHWSRGTAPKITPEVVSERFIEHIEKVFNDPNAAWWEIDGAFGALRAAMPDDIRRNRKHIDRFAAHDEWYLRDSSYWSMVGLGKGISGPEFLELAKRYNQSQAVFERSSMNGGIDQLIRRERVPLDDEVVAKYVQIIASQLYEAMIVEGYDQFAAGQEAAHRTMMVIADFKNPPYQLIAAQLAKYLEDWKPSDNQHANWLITGNKWQPGLVKIAKDLGKDAGPIIEQFERCLKQNDWDLKPSKRNPQPAIHEAMRQAVVRFNAQ